MAERMRVDSVTAIMPARASPSPGSFMISIWCSDESRRRDALEAGGVGDRAEEAAMTVSAS